MASAQLGPMKVVLNLRLNMSAFSDIYSGGTNTEHALSFKKHHLLLNSSLVI